MQAAGQGRKMMSEGGFVDHCIIFALHGEREREMHLLPFIGVGPLSPQQQRSE